MLLQDVRYAWRSLTKSRGFTAIAVACLALGIGINTTIFSVVDGVMLQPYPYQDPDGIAIIHGRNQRLHINRANLSYADYKDLRDQTSTVQSMAAFVRISSGMRTAAIEVSSICNDMRLLVSGPRTGFGELRIPAVQPGSS